MLTREDAWSQGPRAPAPSKLWDRAQSRAEQSVPGHCALTDGLCFSDRPAQRSEEVLQHRRPWLRARSRGGAPQRRDGGCRGRGKDPSLPSSSWLIWVVWGRLSHMSAGLTQGRTGEEWWRPQAVRRGGAGLEARGTGHRPHESAWGTRDLVCGERTGMDELDSEVAEGSLTGRFLTSRKRC